MPDTLDMLRWKKRILIVAGTDSHLVELQINRAMAEKPELDDRDLIVLSLRDGSVEVLHGDATLETSASEISDKFDVEPDQAFVAILVGKDGAAKWRAIRPVEFQEIAAVIDAMPMRQAEKE